MGKAPFVSVIIPNYNHAEFLNERIQSVLNQTYKNFEVIILDDKSLDNSVDVINKYKGNPLISHIVLNESNSGSSFIQWHRGFELAKGNVIWIAESDDSCDSTFLEELVKGYVEGDAVVSFCKSSVIDERGHRSKYWLQRYLNNDIITDGRSFVAQHMISRNSVANASSAIFDRIIAMELPSIYMKMRGEGDWLFWIMLMEKGNVYFLNKELNFFRQHGHNTTGLIANQGIGDYEHYEVFRYLKHNNYFSWKEACYERMRWIDKYKGTTYLSRAIKRRVLMRWDKYGLFRAWLYLSDKKYKLIDRWK